MSVLDRKMFKKVAKLKHGGNPNIDHYTGAPMNTNVVGPVGMPGGMNQVDTSIYQTANTSTPSGITAASNLSDVVEGMQEFYPTAVNFADTLFPQKTAEEYAAEAKMLYQKDFSAEKEAIATQKEADVASSLINLGARLLTGRGKALDVFGQAVQATLPEFTAARRATRKEEAEVRGAERAVDAQRATYALTKEQEDAVNRANVVSQAMFSNLGFFQELQKTQFKNELDLTSTFKLVLDKETGLNTEVSLETLLKDAELPENERRFKTAKDYTTPFVAYDNVIKENKFFSTYEEFAIANSANPGRYGDKKENQKKDWKRVFNSTTKKIEFVEADKLDPTVHTPADSLEYMEVIDTQQNGKVVYVPKNVPLDTNRYVPNVTPVALVKSFSMGSFTHPMTGEYGRYAVKIMKDDQILIPKLDANGDVILQANGRPEWMSIGSGLADFTKEDPVSLTAADVLPKKALNEQLSTILLYDRNIMSIDKVITNLLDDPTIAGLPGLIQDIKQRGFGMIADLVAADDQISILTNVLDNVKDNFSDGRIETAEGSGEFVDVNALFDSNSELSQQFWGEFKPELAENRVRINAIAYAVARARKSSGRLNLDDIKRAYESLKITGFVDAKTVIAGLITVREELRLANNDMKVLYEFNKGVYPQGYTGVATIDPKNLPKAFYDNNGDLQITLPDEINATP
jgi:hypothetical protein